MEDIFLSQRSPARPDQGLDVLVWVSAGSRRRARLLDLIERRGMRVEVVGSDLMAAVRLAQVRPRLLLMVSPDGGSCDERGWRVRAEVLKRLVAERFAGVRCLVLEAEAKGPAANSRPAEGVSGGGAGLGSEARDDGVVLMRAQPARERLSPVLVQVPDAERLRPPEITQEELRMLLGPYPDEESA